MLSLYQFSRNLPKINKNLGIDMPGRAMAPEDRIQIGRAAKNFENWGLWNASDNKEFLNLGV